MTTPAAALKPFRYNVPRLALKLGIDSIVVDAWETACPGLIIQKIHGSQGFSLTHRDSGFILKSHYERYPLIEAAEQLAKLSLDFEVPHPWQVMGACANLVASDVQKFTMIINGSPISIRQVISWRKIASERSTQEGFMAWWRSTR